MVHFQGLDMSCRYYTTSYRHLVWKQRCFWPTFTLLHCKYLVTQCYISPSIQKVNLNIYYMFADGYCDKMFRFMQVYLRDLYQYICSVLDLAHNCCKPFLKWQSVHRYFNIKSWLWLLRFFAKMLQKQSKFLLFPSIFHCANTLVKKKSRKNRNSNSSKYSTPL